MDIKITRKKIKNLILRVSDKGEILVSAPHRLPESYIKDFVSSKKDWIEKRLKLLADKKDNSTLRFTTGETFIYLGNPYKIEIINSDIDGCSFKDRALVIATTSNETSHKEKLVYEFIWKTLTEILYRLNKEIGHTIGYLPEKIRVRDMKTRWGSCNSHKRSITYNFRLYTKPIEAIEYVVLHELSHIPHPHHQKGFWNFVEKYMPDFKERKKILKEK